MSSIYYWEKLTFSKLCRKTKFLWKKIWRNALALKSKKVQGTFGETLSLALLSSAVIGLQKRSSDFFSLGDKRSLSEFLSKWGWFQEHNERFPKYLGWKLKSHKTETRFCRWKSTDSNVIYIFLSLGNLCPFLLAKEKTWKRIFNTNSELSQNHTEKQIMPSKTTMIGYLMVYGVLYSLLVLSEKLAFFNKQLQGSIISLATLFGVPFLVLIMF